MALLRLLKALDILLKLDQIFPLLLLLSQLSVGFENWSLKGKHLITKLAKSTYSNIPEMDKINGNLLFAIDKLILSLNRNKIHALTHVEKWDQTCCYYI